MSILVVRRFTVAPHFAKTSLFRLYAIHYDITIKTVTVPDEES